MKKGLLVLLFILTAKMVSAQAYSNFDKNQEVKFNIGMFLATTSVEFGYEYFLGDDTSVGAILHFDGDAEDYNGSFGFGPNFRAYFGDTPRSGAFAEALGLYIKGEKKVTESGSRIKKEYGNVALGLGGGYKWVTRSERFTLELNGGFGRNINPKDFQDDFIFRAGLSIGFRF
ncbi:DUF3575 domain-containing protein [Cellulophaga fucicola]|uniref:DUF3575 domain-containing protein n=1 Tax=Cellulophaga fucicola TaxID=76595 RepID=A0A1K1Q305_9FLAO|nr:DUF3575 domain-containing protein [Cellulophaga fucicola]SFW53478.1 hypothetical protein SAMN05660313_02214 [Cellulophaga fucicola]